MRNWLTLSLLLSSFLHPAYTGAAESTARKENIAVYISPVEMPGKGEFDAKHLKECLYNHLDYYLWYKGYDYSFVAQDTAVKFADLQNRLERNKFDGLLYIEPRAKFKIKKLKRGSGNDGSARFGGYLELGLTTRYIKFSAPSSAVGPLENHGETLPRWVDLDSEKPETARADILEPPDFVVKRLLSQALFFLRQQERPNVTPKISLPVYLAVDSRIVQDTAAGSERDLMAALDYASRSLERQFGFGLKFCGEERFRVNNIGLSDLDRLFKTFLHEEPSHPDTLLVGIFRPAAAELMYTGNHRVQIGLSDLGKQTSLVAEMEPPNRQTVEWKVFLNGQLLLHEIGHLLGAIHVSDIESIMTSKATWLASDRFDSLNKFVINAARGDTARIQTVARYLDLLAAGIETTGYRLSDYPAVFFSYINMNQNRLPHDEFHGSTFRRSIPYASGGYMQFLLKRDEAAKSLFYIALAGAPEQGAIHYYLSHVTSGELSRRHLRTAAQIGYYQAVQETIASGD